MNFQTTKLNRINDLTWQLPVDANDILNVSYWDGTIMPPSYYSFLAPRLVKLSCPLDSSIFSCLNATYITGKRYCGCKSCDNKPDCGCDYGGYKWQSCK